MALLGERFIAADTKWRPQLTAADIQLATAPIWGTAGLAGTARSPKWQVATRSNRPTPLHRYSTAAALG
jgi:hypothetical protein